MKHSDMCGRRLVLVSVLALSGISARGDSGTWDGETSEVWALNSNWNNNAVAFPSGDQTATFNGTGNNRTNINVAGLSGIQNITFDTTSVNNYNIGLEPINSQTLVFRNSGNIRLTSSANKSQNILAAVQLGPDRASASYTFQNDHLFSVLTVAGDVAGPASGGSTAGDKTIYVNGSGMIRFLGNVTRGGANNLDLIVNSSGITTFSGTNILRLMRMYGGPGSVVDIGAGMTTFTNSGGENIHSTYGGTITGSGALVLSTATGENNADNRVDDLNATLNINCRLTGGAGFELYSANGASGTIALNNTNNDFLGNIFLNTAGTLSAVKFGNQGSTDSSLGAGVRIRFNNNNLGGPTLKYIGTGETSNRRLELNSHSKIEQAGTGHLILSSPVNIVAGGGLTLTLQGSSAGTAEISGTVSNGTAGVAVTKDGTGTWTLSAPNLFNSALTVNNGTLLLTHTNVYAAATTVNGGTLSLAGPAGAIPNTSGVTLNNGGTLTVGNTPADNHPGRVRNAAAVTLNGGTVRFSHSAGAASYSETLGTVAVASGANIIFASQAAAGQTSTLTLSGLTRTAGLVNFVGTGLGASARNRIFINGQADGLIGPWATVNGTALAAYSSTLGVYAAGEASYTDIAARGPSTIQDGATSQVRINSEGEAGPITLGATTTTIGSLTQNTATEAVVDTADKTFRAARVTVPAGKAGVTVGVAAGEGTLSASTAGGGLILESGGATGGLTVNAVIANNTSASALTKAGSGTVTLAAPNTFSGATALNEGTLVLADAAALQNSTLTLGASGTPVFSSAVVGNAFSLGGLTGTRELMLANDFGAPVALSVGQNNASTTYAGSIGGSGSLVKQGGGTLTLSGVNTFSGGVTVNAGLVNAAHVQALGVGPVVNNGTIDFTVSPATYSGASYKISGGGTNNVTIQTNLGGSTSYFDGDYTGFTGVWNIGVGAGATAGRVRMNARDNPASVIVVRTNATLWCNSAIPHNGTLVLQGGNTGESNGQLRLDSNALWAGPIFLAGVFTDANDGFFGSGSGTGFISGQIADAGGAVPVNKVSGNTIGIIGTNNTFGGQVWIRAGTLRASAIRNIGQPSSLGAPANAANGVIKIGNGTTGAQLTYDGMGDTTDRGIELTTTTGTVTLDHSGTNVWQITGDVTTTGAGNKTFRLQGSTVGATGVLAGVVSDYSASTTNTLLKSGTGVWALSGANTFKGNVTVENGVLVIRNSGAFGPGPKNVQAANNANNANPRIHFDGSAGDLTFPPEITFRTSNQRLGAIINESGNNTILGQIHLTSGDGDTILKSESGKLTATGLVYAPSDTSRQLRLWGDGDGEISGVISNGATAALPVIREVGTGTWTLSGANTFSGITHANNGQLIIGGANGRVGGGLTLGGGTLVITNAPDMNLGDRVINSGAVTLNGGKLRFAHPGGEADYSETLGALTVGLGSTAVETSQADEERTSDLTFASLARTGAGTVNFAGAGLGEDSRNRILFSAAPTLQNGIIGPWAMHNGTALASYDSALGVIPAPEGSYADLAAKGPSVIPDNAALNARINEEGEDGDVTLAGDPVNSVNTLLQNTGWESRVSMADRTLRTSGVIIGAGKEALTLGAVEGEGALMPLASGGNILLANYAESMLAVNAALTNNTSASTLGKAGPGPVRLNGRMGLTGAVNIGEGELIFAGSITQTVANVISGTGTLVKDGSGRTTFSAANTLAGPVVIRGGVFVAQNSVALGTVASGTTVEPGGTLDLGGTLSAQGLNLGAEPVTVSGSGVDGRGAIINSSNTSQYNALRCLTLAGDTVFGGEQSGGRWDVRNTGAGQYLNMNGYNITKVGSNLVGLTSVPVTPGAGNITVAEGTFRLESATTLGGSAANTVTVSDGATFDMYQLATPLAWSLALQERGRLITSSGNSLLQNIWAGPVTLNGTAFLAGSDNTQGTITGDISGTGPLVKITSGSNVMRLASTNNTYSGGTIISNGTLWAYHPGALPGYGAASGVTLAGGATLGILSGDGTTGWASGQIADLIANTAFLANNAFLDIDMTAAPVALSDVQRAFTLYARGTNTLTLSGVNTNSTGTTQYGELRVYAGGTVVLAEGSSNIFGRVVVQPSSLGGALYVNGVSRFENLYSGNANGDRPLVVIATNAVMNRMYLSNVVGANGAIVQTGGTVEVAPTTGGTDVLSLGSNGGYGYYRMSGGTLRAGQVSIGGGGGTTGNNGVLEILGGDFATTSTSGWLLWGWVRGNGVVNLYGGSLAGPPSGNDTTMAFSANNDSFAMLNLLGAGAVMNSTGNGTARSFNMAATAGNRASVINLNAGTLLANRIRAANTGTPSIFNFNGGTLKVNAGTANGATFMQGLTSAVVYPGGAVVDTTNNASVVVNQSLLASEGLGVSFIPVAFGGAGYIGAPVVLISGGSGSGATAVATVDQNPGSVTFGQITLFTVTSPGSGYQPGDALSVTLRGGGFLTAAQPGQVFLSQNVASGGLTKRGSGRLVLGGTNTYGGATTILEGTLAFAHPDALPTNASVVVAGGAYDLSGLTVTNSAVSATQGVIFNGALVSDTFVKTGPGLLTLNAGQRSYGPVRIEEGTLALPSRQPGLYEGRVSGSFNTTAANPMTAVALSPRYADIPFSSNAESGGVWVDNSTYIYNGYIWNNSSEPVTWSFAKTFDDSTLLKIDGVTLITNTLHNQPVVATYTLTPGPHPIELRFGQGTGGVGPKVVSNIWTTVTMGFGYDPLARITTYEPGLSTTHQNLIDPGDGSLLTLTTETGGFTDLMDAGSVVEIADGATLDLGSNTQTLAGLSGSGTVQNGTLTVTGTVMPGGEDAIGTLGIAANVTLSGTLVVDVDEDGNSDCLAIDGNVNMTGLALVIADTERLNRQKQYVLMTHTGTRTGVVASVTASDSRWKVIYAADGTVRLIFVNGTVLWMR